MSRYTDALRKVAETELEPGEQLLAGVRAMSAGATARIVTSAAGSAVGGAVGLLVTGRLRGRGRAGEQAAQLPEQVAIGLTDRRLLIFSRSALTGRAKHLVTQVRRADIAAIDGEDSGSKLRPDRLTVRLVDGSKIDFEVVKVDGFQHLVDAFMPD